MPPVWTDRISKNGLWKLDNTGFNAGMTEVNYSKIIMVIPYFISKKSLLKQVFEFPFMLD
jgi:hypothetical protein